MMKMWLRGILKDTNSVLAQYVKMWILQIDL
jgi:hypothetical protein